MRVNAERIANDAVAVLAEDGFGVKLHAVHGQRPMAYRLHDAVLASRRYDEVIGERAFVEA
jgi:hypothetical protein